MARVYPEHRTSIEPTFAEPNEPEPEQERDLKQLRSDRWNAILAVCVALIIIACVWGSNNQPVVQFVVTGIFTMIIGGLSICIHTLNIQITRALGGIPSQDIYDTMVRLRQQGWHHFKKAPGTTAAEKKRIKDMYNWYNGPNNDPSSEASSDKADPVAADAVAPFV